MVFDYNVKTSQCQREFLLLVFTKFQRFQEFAYICTCHVDNQTASYLVVFLTDPAFYFVGTLSLGYVFLNVLVMLLCYCIVNHVSELDVLFQDLKEYISKAGEVTFADAHKRRQGEG